MGKNQQRQLCAFTSHICWSENCPRGSRLYLTVPWKSVGSCGMIPKRERRSCKPIVLMSTESIIILPSAGSTRRNNAPINVVLPLPVRPTIPILSPPSNLQVIPCSTRGVSFRYLIWVKINHTNLLELLMGFWLLWYYTHIFILDLPSNL
jgi:hypothetical protein